MYPLLFELFGRPLSSWVLFALIGAWAGFFSIQKDLIKKGIPSQQIVYLFVGSVLSWFGGAMIGYGMTIGAPQISTGSRAFFSGYVLYGGVVLVLFFGAVTWWSFGWRRNLSIQSLWDVGSIALVWALFFGRLGCTFYGCCYGSPAGGWPGYYLNETHWDYAHMHFPEHLRGVKLHPATLYEAFGMLTILGAISFLRARKKNSSFIPGVEGWICWISYGVIRFLVEFIRMDRRGEGLWGLSPSQCFALFTIALGAVLLSWEIKKSGSPAVRHPSVKNKKYRNS